MAPGIASGGNVAVGGAFLLNSKTEKPKEPLSRTTPHPHFSRARGTEAGRHLRFPASPPRRAHDTILCCSPHQTPEDKAVHLTDDSAQ